MAQRKASMASQSTSSMLASAGRDAWLDICPSSLEDFVLVPPAAPTTMTTTTTMASTQAPRRGVLRYLGPVDFADGLWAGVELVGTLGRNDGSVKGKRYFPCLPGQGLFVRPDTVQPFVGNTKVSSEAPETSRDAGNGQAPPLSTPSSDAANANLQKSLDAAVTRTIELEMEVDDLNTQLAQLRKAEPAHTATSSSPPLTVSGRIELEMEVMSLKDELDAAQRALRTAETTIQQLRQAKATTSSQAPPAVDTAGMAAQLREKTVECDRLRSALHEARAEAAQLAQVLPHGDAAATALAGHPPTVVAADVSALQKKVHELEADKQQLVADMETLWREAAEAEAAAAIRLESVTTAHAQTAQEWQRERDQLQSAQESHMARIAELRAQLETQAADHATAAVDSEARHLRKQQEWEATLEKMEGERRELQDILELTEHELMEEKKQTDQLSEVVTRFRDEAHAHADARNDQLSAAEVQTQRQSQDLLESQRHVQALQAQLQAALAHNKDTARHGAGVLDQGQGTSTAAHPNAAAEIDTLKLRVFQLEKENAVADQLRARFDAVSKELAAVKSEGRQKLENELSERKAERAKAAEALAVMRKERDVLQSMLDKDKASDALRSQALLNASLHGSLDVMERRRYQQLLFRSLTSTTDMYSMPSSSRTTMSDAAVMNPSEMTIDKDTTSSVESTLAAYNTSVRRWREEAAEMGCVGGLLDFTTPEASRRSVQVLFSA